jgi:hypothetical protein
MKLFLYVPLLLFCAIEGVAQTQAHKLQFSSVNTVGLLVGSKGEAFAIQTIAGLKAKKWFGGIGTGLDFYDRRTVPLFLDVRRDLLNKKNTPYLYADAGTGFLWLKSPTRSAETSGSSSPMFNYETGIGYKLTGKNKTALVFSAGYSVKQVKQTFKSFSWVPLPIYTEDNYEHYTAIYRRVVIRLGLQL